MQWSIAWRWTWLLPAVPAVLAATLAAADDAAPTAASRVRMKIDARGELFAPAGRGAEPVRQPIEMEARFDFIEAAPPAAGADQPAAAAVVRRYRDANAALHVDGRSSSTALADDARTVSVALLGTTPVPYLAAGFLARDEADLLETPFDPLLLDRLRPTDAVRPGDTWTVPADVAAGLLAIDTVESGSLEAKLESCAAGEATLAISGIVDGAVDGVPTHVVIEGTCVAEAGAAEDAEADATAARRIHGRVANLAVTIQERRQASHVAPGFDVEARITVARAAAQDAETAAADDASAAAGSRRRLGVGKPGFVWYCDPAGRFDLVHDARWRVVEDGPSGLVLRFVDRGALVGQCSITALPPSDALAPPTIAEVQRDIERSLAGQFGRFEHATEATRSDGVRIVRVVSSGSAENLPFRWMHHVITDARGHRAAATFMLEAPLAKRFAEADRDLVDGLAFTAESPSPGDTAAPADPERPDPDREARLPRETSMP